MVMRDDLRIYRRDGTPYPEGFQGMFEYGVDCGDPAKKIVKQERLPDGRFVSTVWLGLNHQYGDGPPLIFETMVFGGDGDSRECERYSTEAEALAGHKAMVARLRTEAECQ